MVDAAENTTEMRGLRVKSSIPELIASEQACRRRGLPNLRSVKERKLSLQSEKRVFESIIDQVRHGEVSHNGVVALKVNQAQTGRSLGISKCMSSSLLCLNLIPVCVIFMTVGALFP